MTDSRAMSYACAVSRQFMAKAYGRTLTFAAVIGVSLAGGASSAHAALLVEESFNYTAGASLVGQTPAAGFNGGWFVDTGTPAPTVAASGLSYGSVATSGKAAVVQNGGRVEINLDTSATGVFKDYLDGTGNIGKVGTTLYMSFLMKTSASGWLGFEAHNSGGTGDPNRVWYAQRPGDWLDLYSGTDGSKYIGGLSQDTIGAVNLCVVQIDFNSGSDTLTAYQVAANGTASVSRSDTPDNLAAFNNFSISNWSSGPVTVGDIRVGTTFGDVVPVPEPVLGGSVLALGLLALRRRSNRHDIA